MEIVETVFSESVLDSEVSPNAMPGKVVQVRSRCVRVYIRSMAVTLAQWLGQEPECHDPTTAPLLTPTVAHSELAWLLLYHLYLSANYILNFP